MENLSISETESRYFNDLFVCCDAENTGHVTTLKATELFRSANIPNDIVRQITTLVGISQNSPYITRSQFYSCLKLIAAYQASISLHVDILQSSINLPLPRFSWKKSPPPVQKSQEATNNPALTSAIGNNSKIIDSTLSTTEKIRQNQHQRQWNEEPSPDLFVNNINNQIDTTNLDLQSTDSEVEQSETNCGRSLRRNPGGSPEAWSTNSDSPTPTNSVAERPWAKDNLWQGLLGDEHRQLLGTEEESSDRHSSDEDNDIDLETVYQITNEQREYYQKQFKAVQPDPKGLLSGHIARVFFEKSRIPVEELRHIWQLCDVTRDGALSLSEFTAAMHLVVLRRNNIPLPQILPPCLHPNILNQTFQSNEPPEADLLHLDDDDKPISPPLKKINDKDFKRIISVHPDKNLVHINSKSSSQANSITKQTKTMASPPVVVSGHNRTQSISNSPPAEPTTTPPPHPQEKTKGKDWSNQSKEWTKFTESPTSNVSSPGLKPVNFDMQRTAQAVVSDPQILHPVPLRVTPVGSDINEDEINHSQRKSETIISESQINQHDSETSPKLILQQPPSSYIPPTQSHSNRDIQTSGDLRAIQRPQAKKLTGKSVGGIPPPPQRESSIENAIENMSTSMMAVSLTGNKVPQPPIPPPRPHKHTRSSSLDLNKLKMSVRGSTQQAEQIISQNSIDVHIGDDNSSFADFTNFSQTEKNEEQHQTDISMNYKPTQSRQTIPLLQTSQRVSAFEIYKKPNTPRNSQSPDSLQNINQLSQTSMVNNNITTITSIEYEKRIAAINDSLKQVSFRGDKNIVDTLRHLREQNILLLRLCNDLSEELLAIQHKKEEIRTKIEYGNCIVSANNGINLSTNITGSSGNSGTHSNV